MEKIINHVGLTFSAILKSRETSAVKKLLNKEKYSLGRIFICNYRASVIMLSYLQGSMRIEIPMNIHQCAQFFNNMCLVQEHTARFTAKYLAST